MATILDFKVVAKILGYEITKDTAKERAMIMKPRNIHCYKLKECASGLYY